MSPARAHQARVIAALGGRVLASAGVASPSPEPANDAAASPVVTLEPIGESLARAHKARVLAALGGRVEADGTGQLNESVKPLSAAASPSLARPGPPLIGEGPDARAYQLQLASLGNDERRLKSFQSVERKIDAKREMLPAYAPWVDGRLAAVAGGGQAVDDAVLATVMVWRMDVGDWAGGLQLAEHVLRHGLKLPARFTRTPAVLVAETVANAACAAHEVKASFGLAELLFTGSIVAGHDMPDEVRARLHKAVGQELVRLADEAAPIGSLDPQVAQAVSLGVIDGSPAAYREAALLQLRRARELDGRAGVAALINRLEREQAKEDAAAG